MAANITNVAVWGLGNHARKNILPALNECTSTNLIGVYSRNKDVVNDCIKSFDCITWDSPKEMLSTDKVDVIYLSTPIGLHVEQGISILESNKHFWCEKPIAYSLEEAEKLVNIAKKNKLTIAEGFMYQFHPQYQYLKNYINREEFGQIKSIKCHFGLPFLESPGFRYNPELGGSALLDVGCYPLSVLLDLFPEEKLELKYIKKQNLKSYEVDMEGCAVFNISEGIDAFLEWGVGRAYRNDIDISGSNGAIYTDRIFSKPPDFEPTFTLTTTNGSKSQQSCQPANHFVAMFEYFGRLSGDDTLAGLESSKILRRADYLGKLHNIETNFVN